MRGGGIQEHNETSGTRRGEGCEVGVGLGVGACAGMTPMPQRRPSPNNRFFDKFKTNRANLG